MFPGSPGLSSTRRGARRPLSNKIQPPGMARLFASQRNVDAPSPLYSDLVRRCFAAAMSPSAAQKTRERRDFLVGELVAERFHTIPALRKRRIGRLRSIQNHVDRCGRIARLRYRAARQSCARSASPSLSADDRCRHGRLRSTIDESMLEQANAAMANSATDARAAPSKLRFMCRNHVLSPNLPLTVPAHAELRRR